MRLWHSLNFFNGKMENCHSMPKNKKKYVFPERNSFSKNLFQSMSQIFEKTVFSLQKFPLHASKAALRTLPWNLCPKAEKLLLEVRNWWKISIKINRFQLNVRNWIRNHFFFKRMLSYPRYSFGYAQWILKTLPMFFDSLLIVCLPNVQKRFWKISKSSLAQSVPLRA